MVFLCFCYSQETLRTIPSDEIRSYLPDGSVDVVIGGPPCQGFSTIGKRVSSDPEKRAKHDPRNELVLTYAKLIRELRPKFIVMENVKGILTLEGGIRIDNENLQGLFSGRDDSIKAKLVNQLNSLSISEDLAWEEYAKKVRKDSHSYREVVDSGLFHIGFLNPEGSLTELGYKFVEACERVGSPYIGIPMEILKAAVLQNGQYGAMLHYFYRLSEEKFESDLFAFSERDSHGNYHFKDQEYLIWLDDYFAHELHISKKSTERAGGTRKPFQAELAFLKKMGFVKTNGRSAAYRVGVGLEIDWPQVQNSMLYYQGL